MDDSILKEISNEDQFLYDMVQELMGNTPRAQEPIQTVRNERREPPKERARRENGRNSDSASQLAREEYIERFLNGEMEL